jgi:hypothetical protein
VAVRMESLLGAAVPMRSDKAESHGAHPKRNQLVSSQASSHDGFLGTAHFDVLLLSMRSRTGTSLPSFNFRECLRSARDHDLGAEQKYCKSRLCSPTSLNGALPDTGHPPQRNKVAVGEVISSTKANCVPIRTRKIARLRK